MGKAAFNALGSGTWKLFLRTDGEGPSNSGGNCTGWPDANGGAASTLAGNASAYAADPLGDATGPGATIDHGATEGFDSGVSPAGDFTAFALLRITADSSPGNAQSFISMAATNALYWYSYTGNTNGELYDDGTTGYNGNVGTFTIPGTYRLILIRSSGTLTAYINGASVGSISASSTNNLRFGSDPNGTTFSMEGHLLAFGALDGEALTSDVAALDAAISEQLAGVGDAAGGIAGVSAGATTTTATLVGDGQIVGASSSSATVDGTLSGGEPFVGASAGAATATATLVGAGALVGAATGAATAAGALGGDEALEGSSAGVATVSATLGGRGALLGATDGGTTAVAGELDADGALVGALQGTATTSGALGGAGALQGTATATSSATASAASDGPIAGVASGVATVSATLRATGAIQGAAAGSGGQAATVAGQGALQGAVAGSSTALAVGGAPGQISGAAAGLGGAAGTLGAVAAIQATSAGSSAPTGVVGGAGRLSAAAAAVAAAVATLAAVGALQGSAAGTATSDGELDAAPPGAVVGAATGVATTTGNLVGTGGLVGVAVGVAVASATTDIETPIFSARARFTSPLATAVTLPRMSYRVGRTFALTLECIADGAHITPDTYSLRLRKPDKSVIAAALTPTGDNGIYEAEVTPAEGEHGLWFLEWEFSDSEGRSYSHGQPFRVDPKVF